MSRKINTLLASLVLISITSMSAVAGQYNQDRGQRMAQELNLTTEQQTQVKEIMEEQKSKAKAWRTNHQEETKGKLSQVLNDEQMAKFDAIKKQRKEKRMMRKNNKKPQ